MERGHTITQNFGRFIKKEDNSDLGADTVGKGQIVAINSAK